MLRYAQHDRRDDRNHQSRSLSADRQAIGDKAMPRKQVRCDVHLLRVAASPFSLELFFYFVFFLQHVELDTRDFLFLCATSFIGARHE